MNKIILTIITLSIFLLSGCELERLEGPEQCDPDDYICYADDECVCIENTADCGGPPIN